MAFLEEKTPNSYPDETLLVIHWKSEGKSQIKSMCYFILCHSSGIVICFPNISKYSVLIQILIQSLSQSCANRLLVSF